MNRRKLIELTPDELRTYVTQGRTITLCTNGKDGYPHAIAMWYASDDDLTVYMTTYGKSQKTMNIRRDARVALHIESGETYETLKGVLIRGDADLVEDSEVVLRTLKRVHEKMLGSLPDGIEDALRSQARKRVVIRIRARRISSWDHGKLAGTY